MVNETTINCNKCEKCKNLGDPIILGYVFVMDELFINYKCSKCNTIVETNFVATGSYLVDLEEAHYIFDKAYSNPT